MALQEHGDGEGERDSEASAARVFNEFECPLCAASNPYDDGFRAGDEVRCFYCGSEFRVAVNDEGKLRLRET